MLRFPVSNDYLLPMLASGGGCKDEKCPCHEAAKYCGNAYYELVRRLVWTLANRYEKNCYFDSKEDLVQICFENIVKNAHMFDPKKARITTWTWHVSENQLGKRVNHTRVRLGLGILIERSWANIEEQIFAEEYDQNKEEWKSSLRENLIERGNKLISSNPEWKDTLVKIFGFKEDGTIDEFPHRLNISDLCSTVPNNKRIEAKRFIKSVVRPVLEDIYKPKDVEI